MSIQVFTQEERHVFPKITSLKIYTYLRQLPIITRNLQAGPASHQEWLLGQYHTCINNPTEALYRVLQIRTTGSPSTRVSKTEAKDTRGWNKEWRSRMTRTRRNRTKRRRRLIQSVTQKCRFPELKQTSKEGHGKIQKTKSLREVDLT